ncbi:Adenylate cyclase type 10 [Phlyctochytrium planicorne]|nr:Adenylate cyclase type 10 [Phlyctochytrium planicorne]
MRLESLLPRRLRAARVPSASSVEIEEFGCVAVVDISGYTRLTDKLAALGGIDRIRDFLNPPFELIIKAVHRRFGSVIKLAGDSAIVTWNVPKTFRESLRDEISEEEEIEKRAREHVCHLAIMCCIELLESFADYEIEIENVEQEFLSGGRLIARKDTASKKSTFNLVAPQYGTSSNVLGSVANLGINRSPSYDVVNNSAKTESSKQRLQLHIGLGFGNIQHVFVGLPSNDSSQTPTDRARSEYFIAGKALHDAGIMLGSGKSGQLLFRHELLETLGSWPVISRFKDNVFTEVCVVETQKAAFYELKSMLPPLLPSRDLYDWSEEILPKSSLSDRSLVKFIEPSLLKHLLDLVPSESPSRILSVGKAGFERKNSIFSDNMNQYRTITVLFLHFPMIPVDVMGQSETIMSDVEFVAQECLRVVSKHGGTCRQIHADEKGLSVLLVWGVEGFSHEKGDHHHALTAAVEMRKILATRKWSSDVLARGSTEVSNFSLALTMGKA